MQQIIDRLSAGDWIALISSLAGAIIGGIISAAVSYWTAQQSANVARQLAADPRRDLQKLAAFRLMSKLMTIAGNIDFLNRHICGPLSDLDLANNKPDVWTKVVPVVGH